PTGSPLPGISRSASIRSIHRLLLAALARRAARVGAGLPPPTPKPPGRQVRQVSWHPSGLPSSAGGEWYGAARQTGATVEALLPGTRLHGVQGMHRARGAGEVGGPSRVHTAGHRDRPARRGPLPVRDAATGGGPVPPHWRVPRGRPSFPPRLHIHMAASRSRRPGDGRHAVI